MTRCREKIKDPRHKRSAGNHLTWSILLSQCSLATTKMRQSVVFHLTSRRHQPGYLWKHRIDPPPYVPQVPSRQHQPACPWKRRIDPPPYVLQAARKSSTSKTSLGNR
ncbi:hypothetical protein ACER0C_027208 [Sarotherodon galilaeus]